MKTLLTIIWLLGACAVPAHLPAMVCSQPFFAPSWCTSGIYDSNGNTRTNGSNVYLYDYANRLTKANSGGVVIIYDADGNRVARITSTSTNLYLVSTVNPSGYPQVVEEFTVSGSTTNLARVYSYGVDLIGQWTPNVSTNFFGFDGLGSTRFLLDSSGSVAESYAYDAFGTMIASNTTPSTAYLFAGEQWDSDLRCYYLRKRLMSPPNGRFMTGDTFEGHQTDPVSLHRYLYAAANPVNNTDPSGRFTVFELSISIPATIGLRGQYEGARAPAYAGALATAWRLVKILGFAVATTYTLTDEEADNARIYYHYSQDPPLSFVNGLRAGAFVTEVSGLDSSMAMFGLGIRPPLWEYPVKIDPLNLEPAFIPVRGYNFVSYQVIRSTPPGSVLPPRPVPQTHPGASSNP